MPLEISLPDILASALSATPVVEESLSREARLEAISTHWSTPLLSPYSLAIAFGVLGLLILGMAAWHRYRTWHLGSAPLLTFNHLARRAGLTLGQQWLLVRLARRAGLATPLTLLLAPSVLRRYASTWALPEARPPRRRLVHRFDALGMRLFGDQWSPLGTVAVVSRPIAA
ncbi:MAG: hypothetical protein JJU36_14610 [Phycisphaeraceae bacterium]|nr:hypothetical protein [Phycisphaeraceae bacterium]